MELPLRALLDSPTVAGLALLIDRRNQETERILRQVEALSEEEAKELIDKGPKGTTSEH
jgi:hypothetical protein